MDDKASRAASAAAVLVVIGIGLPLCAAALWFAS